VLSRSREEHADAMTDDVTAEIITSIGIALASLVAALTGTLTVILTRRTSENMRQALIQGNAIHTLVNSNMGAQLRISAVALRQLANRSADPQEIVIAEEAERLLREHERKQAVVDIAAAEARHDAFQREAASQEGIASPKPRRTRKKT